MKFLLMMSLTLFLCACEGGSGDSAEKQVASPINNAPAPGPSPAPAPAPAPQTVQVSIYSMTRTIAPSQSYPALTFTATASCLEYGGIQYCWDDGLHTTTGGPFPFKDTYWGFQAGGSGSMQSCKLSCNDDFMWDSRNMSGRRNFLMPVLSGTVGQEVDYILNNGVETQTSCTDDGTTLTCGSLVVNL